MIERRNNKVAKRSCTLGDDLDVRREQCGTGIRCEDASDDATAAAQMLRDETDSCVRVSCSVVPQARQRENPLATGHRFERRSVWNQNGLLNTI